MDPVRWCPFRCLMWNFRVLKTWIQAQRTPHKIILIQRLSWTSGVQSSKRFWRSHYFHHDTWYYILNWYLFVNVFILIIYFIDVFIADFSYCYWHATCVVIFFLQILEKNITRCSQMVLCYKCGFFISNVKCRVFLFIYLNIHISNGSKLLTVLAIFLN